MTPHEPGQGSLHTAGAMSSTYVRSWLGWARRVVGLWSGADGARMSAAMSFYGVLSLAPLLVFLVALLGWWLLGENPGPVEGSGIALIVLALLVISRKGKRSVVSVAGETRIKHG